MNAAEWLAQDAAPESSESPKRKIDKQHLLLERESVPFFITCLDGKVKITPKKDYYELEIIPSGQEDGNYESISFSIESPRFQEDFLSLEELGIFIQKNTCQSIRDALKNGQKVELEDGFVNYSEADGVFSIEIMNDRQVIIAKTRITFDKQLSQKDPSVQDFSEFLDINTALDEIYGLPLTEALIFFMPLPLLNRLEG